jgi:hypothetical protein
VREGEKKGDYWRRGPGSMRSIEGGGGQLERGGDIVAFLTLFTCSFREVVVGISLLW